MLFKLFESLYSISFLPTLNQQKLLFRRTDIMGNTKIDRKSLNKRKDELVKEIKKLDKLKEKGEISEEEYQEKRYVIERELVEIMDRLTQLGFLSR